ncbi:MAG: hypothetical protein OHK0056_17490 [Bacteriovoracaceae bacterium]
MPLNKKEKIFLEIDTTEMSASQIRQLKTLTALLNHVLTTDEESEYFDGAAEAVRMCASMIKQANFIEVMKDSKIPYADQVIEFSVDVLQEHMSNSKVVTYDN